MKENKEYVQNQIDTLSNEIIVLQDEIKFLEKEKDNFHYENERENIFHLNKFENNEKLIAILENLKRTDKLHYENEILNKENERITIIKEIKKLHLELSSLNSKELKNYRQTDDKNYLLETNLIKINKLQNKIFNNNSFISSYESHIKCNKENISMLKEEKISTLKSTENLTSEIETIEELLRNYTLNDSIKYTESFYSDKLILKTFENIGTNLDCFSYELKIINPTKLTKRLLNYFNQQFMIIEENSFNQTCSKCLSLVNENNKLEVDDFFHLLTKRIFDQFRMKATVDSIRIELDKLTLGLKMNLKLVYLEEISSKNIDFLNKGYKVIKNAILKEKKEIESKYQQSSEKIVRLREKLSILEKGSKTSDDLLYKSLDLQHSNSSNLDERIKFLFSNKENIEKQIIDLKNRFNEKFQNYDEQICQIDKLKRKTEIVYINKFTDVYEKEIKNKKALINDKQRQIQDFVKKSYKFFNNYIDKINNTLHNGKRNEKFIKFDLINRVSSSLSKSYAMQIFDYNKEIIIPNNNLNKINLTSSQRIGKSSSRIPNSFENEFSHINQNNENNFYINKNIEINENENRSRLRDQTSELTINKLSKSNSQLDFKNRSNPINYLQSTKNEKNVNYPLDDKIFNDRLIQSTQIQCNKHSYEEKYNNINKNKTHSIISNVIPSNDTIYQISSPEDLILLENPLLKVVKCFKRLRNCKIRNSHEEFDPFNNTIQHIIEKLKFEKALISLDNSFKKINIEMKGINTGYWIKEVDYLEISKKMTDILHIHRINKIYLNSKAKSEIYLPDGKKNNSEKIVLNGEYKEKCLNAKYFLLSLIMKNQIRIELIFPIFIEYKIWAKKLDFLIKNQYKIHFITK